MKETQIHAAEYVSIQVLFRQGTAVWVQLQSGEYNSAVQAQVQQVGTKIVQFQAGRGD